MSLNNLIITRVASELDRVALIGKNERVSFSDLIGMCSDMHGKRVVVFISDTLSLVKTLVSLDGSAQAICPISTATDKKELYHLVSENKFDAVKFVKVGSEIIGGQGGGGRKDFAQAGGQDQSKIDQAFEKLKTLI